MRGVQHDSSRQRRWFSPCSEQARSYGACAGSSRPCTISEHRSPPGSPPRSPAARSVEAAYRMVSALNVAQRGVPEWSRTVVGLSDAIPDDAYLTAFRTRGDSVIVEGLAVRASRGVRRAWSSCRALANVRAAVAGSP